MLFVSCVDIFLFLIPLRLDPSVSWLIHIVCCRLLAQDLSDESSPAPAARAQAGLILKNHLTSKDHAQVCPSLNFSMLVSFTVHVYFAAMPYPLHDLTEGFGHRRLASPMTGWR